MNGHDPGLPIEQFIQALTSQLDRVQAAMALKAKAGLPLTFAVKELSIDLRTHVEMVDSVVRIRPAEPGETEASNLHLNITTITRPMIEENTRSYRAEVGEPSLKEVLGPTMSAEEQRRLEWVGVQSVSQLRQLHEQAGEQTIQQVADIPVNRLRLALERSARPFVTEVRPVAPDDAPPVRPPGMDSVLRIRGVNLSGRDAPVVHVAGRPASILSSSATELLVAAPALPEAGTVSVRTGPGPAGAVQFSLATGQAFPDGETAASTPPP